MSPPSLQHDYSLRDLAERLDAAATLIGGSRLNALISSADAALYAAKEAGRNRVVLGA